MAIPPQHRIAVIDLGTNTFHLLIAEITGESRWVNIYRERVFVNLASDGINHISAGATARGLSTIEYFNRVLRSHNVAEIIAVGTAALRVAGNSQAFIHMVEQSTGIAVEVISGEREADLIARGVLAALPDTDTPILIMDIGGGSVEMILMHHDRVLFRSSSPVGVAVLYEQFHHEEPISKISIERLNRHLEITFAELLAQLESLPDTVLVGASGTFEVVESILVPHKEEDARPYSTAESDDFIPIYSVITGMDLAARIVHPAIPESRAKYIVVAVHLIQFILTRLGSNIFYTSTYAMKEGIIVEKSMDIKE